MSVFTTTMACYNQARQNYLAIEAAGWEKVDPPMRELVQLLNKMPGIVTTDCCAAHPEKLISKRMYVAAFLVESGEQSFLNWFDLTNDKIMENSHDPIVDRLKCQLQFYARRRMFTLGHARISTRSVSVQMPIRTVREQELFLGFMVEAAKEILFKIYPEMIIPC